MPALPPTPSPVVKITYGYSVDSANFGVSHCFSYSGGVPSPADKASLATGAYEAWGDHLVSLLTQDGYLASVTVTDLSNPTDPSGEYSAVTEGSRTGDMVDLAACTVIDATLGRRYRGSRPKMFHPFGIVSDRVEGNAWAADFIEEVNTGWAAQLLAVAGLVADSTHLSQAVGVSFYEGFHVVTNPSTGRARNVPLQRATPLVTPITAYNTRVRLGSQRRRLRAA